MENNNKKSEKVEFKMSFEIKIAAATTAKLAQQILDKNL